MKDSAVVNPPESTEKDLAYYFGHRLTALDWHLDTLNLSLHIRSPQEALYIINALAHNAIDPSAGSAFIRREVTK